MLLLGAGVGSLDRESAKLFTPGRYTTMKSYSQFWLVEVCLGLPNTMVRERFSGVVVTWGGHMPITCHMSPVTCQ